MGRLARLFIPRKGSSQPRDLDIDWRAIEQWAQNVGGIIELTSTGATVTITNPFGPITNLEATGGGGGGITDITSINSTLTVTDPTGPTTDLKVTGYPFLQYSDGDQNTGYGLGVFLTLTTGANDNTAVGYNALTALTTATNNTAIGQDALAAITTTGSNTAVGHNALLVATGTQNTGVGSGVLNNLVTGGQNTAVGLGAGSSLVTGSTNTAIGDAAGFGVTTVISNATAIGAGTQAQADGTVAIGRDHTGTSAIASAQDDFVLGTSAHVVNFNNNTTGSGTALLGTNSPAITNTAPYTWVKVKVADGSICYLPVWK